MGSGSKLAGMGNPDEPLGSSAASSVPRERTGTAAFGGGGGGMLSSALHWGSGFMKPKDSRARAAMS